MQKIIKKSDIIEKNKGGRPKYQVSDKDREIVKLMAGHNIPQEKISIALDISINTLCKHFKKELSIAAVQFEAQLISNLFNLAKGKDGTAFRANEFLLNCRFGWSRYAAPIPPKEPSLGKKEQLDMAARTGHEDSEWGELLN